MFAVLIFNKIFISYMHYGQMLKSSLITIGKLYHFFTGKTLKENYMYQKQWTWTSLNTLYNYVLLIITTVIKNVCLSITSLISCKILYDLKM